MINPGQYATQPEGYFVDDNGATNVCQLNFAAGHVINVTPTGSFKIVTPKDVIFVGGNPTLPAQARIYSLFTVEEVELTPPLVGGYKGDIQVSFSGGEILPAAVTPAEHTHTEAAILPALQPCADQDHHQELSGLRPPRHFVMTLRATLDCDLGRHMIAPVTKLGAPARRAAAPAEPALSACR
jgi:hypothetical protein